MNSARVVLALSKWMVSTQRWSGTLVLCIPVPVRTEKYFLQTLQRYGVGMAFGSTDVRVLRHLGYRLTIGQRMPSSQREAVPSSAQVCGLASVHIPLLGK